MWASQYWSNSYWPEPYWQHFGESRKGTGGGLYVFDQEADPTGLVEVPPAWIFTNLPKQPEQIINSSQTRGTVRTLNITASSRNLISPLTGVRYLTIGNTVIDLIPDGPPGPGTIQLQGSAVSSVYTEGSVGNS